MKAALDLFRALGPEDKRAEAVEPAVLAAATPAGETFSEEYRHQCEVRHVRRMSRERRDEYLEGVEKKRGAKAAGRIRGDL